MDLQKTRLQDLNQNFQINIPEVERRITEYINKQVNNGLIDSDYEIKVEPGETPYSFNVKVYDKIPYVKTEIVIDD